MAQKPFYPIKLAIFCKDLFNESDMALAAQTNTALKLIGAALSI